MAYIDKYAARRPNIAATAAVIAIEAGLAIAVFKGLAVTLLPPTIPRNPEGTNVEVPLPQPTPTERPVEHLPDTHPTPPPPLPPPAGGLGKPADPIPLDPPSPFPVPTATPIAPLPLPTPVASGHPATPRGNPGGWVSDSDYPARDLREGNQGRVGFTLGITADGKVASCRVTSPSGHPGLDEATCALVSRRARFTPAMGADGKPGAGSYTGTIRWVIPDGSPANASAGRADLPWSGRRGID